MTYVVKYMRYHYPGTREFDTLGEAISWSNWTVDDGWCAPEAIIGPDGSVVVDDDTLTRIYSEQFGVIETEEIVQRLAVNAINQSPSEPRSDDPEGPDRA